MEGMLCIKPIRIIIFKVISITLMISFLISNPVFATGNTQSIPTLLPPSGINPICNTALLSVDEMPIENSADKQEINAKISEWRDKREFTKILSFLTALEPQTDKSKVYIAIESIINLAHDTACTPCCINHELIEVLIRACKENPELFEICASKISILLKGPQKEVLFKQKRAIGEIITRLTYLSIEVQDDQTFIQRIHNKIPSERLLEILRDCFHIKGITGLDNADGKTGRRNIVISKDLVMREFNNNWYFLEEKNRFIGFIEMYHIEGGTADLSLYIHIFEKTGEGIGARVMQWAAKKVGENGIIEYPYSVDGTYVNFLLECKEKGIFKEIEITSSEFDHISIVNDFYPEWHKMVSMHEYIRRIEVNKHLFVRGVARDIPSQPILVLNCGSSSVKYQLIDMDDETVLTEGAIEKIGEEDSDVKNHEGAVSDVLEIILKEKGIIPVALGHRVVHGGEKFSGSVLITDEVINTIEECSELAPLHNPANLEGIKACKKVMPDIPQVAVFDTAFHQTMSEVAFRYGIQEELYEKNKLRRYGFHGSSHRYVMEEAVKRLNKPIEKTKIITVHLGNGCSVTAINKGESVDTSMGLTPLEGLMMGTRSGDIDAGLILYLMNLGWTNNDINKSLNKKSGLLGISGTSNDIRTLISSADKGDKRAQLALDMFVYRVFKYIYAYYGILDGVDAIVLTGGIGQTDNAVRDRILKELERFFDKNIKYPPQIYSIPTNEEIIIARDTKVILEAFRSKYGDMSDEVVYSEKEESISGTEVKKVQGISKKIVYSPYAYDYWEKIEEEDVYQRINCTSLIDDTFSEAVALAAQGISKKAEGLDNAKAVMILKAFDDGNDIVMNVISNALPAKKTKGEMFRLKKKLIDQGGEIKWYKIPGGIKTEIKIPKDKMPDQFFLGENEVITIGNEEKELLFKEEVDKARDVVGIEMQISFSPDIDDLWGEILDDHPVFNRINCDKGGDLVDFVLGETVDIAHGAIVNKNKKTKHTEGVIVVKAFIENMEYGIDIMDNGINTPKEPGLLKIIRERLTKIGGSIEWYEIDGGTKAEIRIPILKTSIEFQVKETEIITIGSEKKKVMKDNDLDVESSLKKTWIFKEIAMLTEEALRFGVSEHTLISQLKEHIKRRDVDDAVVLGGFDVDGIKPIKDDKGEIIAFTLPVKKGDTIIQVLKYYLDGDEKDLCIYAKDGVKLFIKAKPLKGSSKISDTVKSGTIPLNLWNNEEILQVEKDIEKTQFGNFKQVKDKNVLGKKNHRKSRRIKNIVEHNNTKLQVISKHVANRRHIKEFCSQKHSLCVPTFFLENEDMQVIELNLEGLGYRTLDEIKKEGKVQITDHMREKISSSIFNVFGRVENRFTHKHLHADNILLKLDEKNNLMDVKVIDWKLIRDKDFSLYGDIKILFWVKEKILKMQVLQEYSLKGLTLRG